jgi:predicted DNA-binding transcriptional regulator YafY
MRADRLISIVMLLQIHEKMTADALSQELEVSTRTIYRDITSLNSAGIPIYTDRGPGGGIALLESYRTTLTGMNEDETRALFMLSIPQTLVELGVGQKLKSALLKLAVALPPDQQAVQAETEQRIYLDSTSWDEVAEAAPHLAVIHQAAWQDRTVRLVYQGSFDTQIGVVMEPYGLVAKMNAWYLIGKVEGYLKVLKISDILEVTVVGERYNRDKDFDLMLYWKKWCEDSRNRRSVYLTRLRMTAALFSKLPLYLGEMIKYWRSENEPGGEQAWYEVIIQYENFFKARESVLSFGRAAEVLEPEALRAGVIDYARQIVDFYQD